MHRPAGVASGPHREAHESRQGVLEEVLHRAGLASRGQRRLSHQVQGSGGREMNAAVATPSEIAHESGHAKGVAVAVVTQNKDEDGLCRVKVSYPWHDKPRESYWARLAV